MNRVARWGTVAAVAAMGLSGCVRTTVDTTISSDDTFSQHAIVAFTDDIANQVGAEAGMDVTGLREQLEVSPDFIDLQERYPGQIEVTDYADEDLRGIEMTLTDLPLEEFNTAANQASTGLTGGAQLTREDDTFVVEMSVPDGVNLEQAGITESQLSLFASSIDVGVSYTFPGPIASASAGTVEGHTVTLGLIDLANGEDIRIVASAGDSINWQPILTWGGVALAFLLVIGGATALIVQDRRKSVRNSLPPHETTDSPEGPGILGEREGPGETRIGEEGQGNTTNP